jgi:prepilin-type N-terminal cleavage/methylation domain-containing protein
MINKNIKSFTLIEILVVIVVIGILSAFIIVGMSSVSSNASVAKSQAWANSLRNAGLVNIVSEWKFQGTTSHGSAAVAGDLTDSWGSNHGTAPANVPDVQTSGCALGRCLKFTATSSDWVDVTTTTGFDAARKQISVFVWVNGASQADKTIVGVWESATLRSWLIESSNAFFKVSFSDDGATIDKTATATAGTAFDSKWHYIGFILNAATVGDTLALYVDSSSVANTVSPSTDINDTNGIFYSSGIDLTIGANTVATPTGFFGTGTAGGLIDDIIVYNTNISMTEVQRQYFSGLNSLLAKGEITNDEYNERISALDNSLGSK